MNKLGEIISRNEERIRTAWMSDMGRSVQRSDLISSVELEEQSRALLSAIAKGTQSSDPTDVSAPGWSTVRDLLQEISTSRARQGFTPSETATFVLSLKQPLFAAMRAELAGNQDELFDNIWTSTQLLDRLSLFTTEASIVAREELISRQQQELLELSTPVVKLWDGILALPIIGTLDSARTQVVMENLLQAVVATNSKYAIIDITGVPTVDTLVAQHLLKTITAARLMGAECIISGVRPQIAQTIVHLGINLEDVITKAKLMDAFALALQRSGRTVVRINSGANASGIAAGINAQGGMMERIPILRMGTFLLITIQVDMHDKLAMQLQDDVTQRIAEWGSTGVLIDISSLEIVDSFIGRMLANIAAMSRVLGAETVVVGMQPAVAITLVELGMSLPGVRTALNVESGMELLYGSLGGLQLGMGHDRTED